jgi:hypothetical protein
MIGFGHRKTIAMTSDGTIDREAIAGELERARVEFH